MANFDTLEESLPDSLKFMRSLWAIAHGLDRTSKLMARQIGVTGPQRLVLRVVGLMPGISAGDLAGLLHVHKSTLTGVLQRLEDQHMIVRRSDDADRRRAVLNLTARGARVNVAAKVTVEAAVSRVLAKTTGAQRAVCGQVLELVANELTMQVTPGEKPRARGRAKPQASGTRTAVSSQPARRR